MPNPETIRTLLLSLAGATRFLLETLSVGAVLVGLLASLRPLPRPWRQPQPARSLASIRLSFGSWLSLALEFQLGADIVATTTTPSGQNLIQLGVVAVIRTFLNLFLGRELEAETRREREIGPVTRETPQPW